MRPLARLVKSHTAVYLLIAVSAVATASVQPTDVAVEDAAKASRMVLCSLTPTVGALAEGLANPAGVDSTQH